jgi:hypothetical protein
MVRIVFVLLALLAACKSVPPEPPPKPFDESPQRIRVVVLLGLDDEVTERVRPALKRALRGRGYKIVRRDDPSADAELWFAVDDHSELARFPDGAPHATLSLTAGLESLHTRARLWSDRGRGVVTEDEDDDDHDDDGFLVSIAGWLFDSAVESVISTTEDTADAAADEAVADLLRRFPRAAKPPKSKKVAAE